MNDHHFTPSRLRPAWQAQLSSLTQQSWVLRHVLSSADLLPRFQHYYTRLLALPRRTRRVLSRRLAGSLAGAALLLALGQGQGLAATIPVAAGVAPDVNADGMCSLIEAMHNANDTTTGGQPYTDCDPGDTGTGAAGADTIALPTNSTQTLTVVDNGNPTGADGSNGLPLITTTMTIEGNDSTIVRDSGAPAFRIMRVQSTGDLTLRETTVSGGQTSAVGGAGLGGGIRSEGPLRIEDSTITNNTSDQAGGGVNAASRLTIANSIISHNRAGIVGGGGVLSRSTAVITDSIIQYNVGISGGGVFNFSGDMTITRSTFAHNSVSGSSGGGGLHGGSITITSSTFVYNDGRTAGAIHITGNAAITNTTIAYNTASSSLSAGGVFNSVNVTITNSTLANNTGGAADGLYAVYGGAATLTNTIFSHTGDNCGISSGTITSNGNNLATDATCNLTVAGDKPTTPAGLDSFTDDGTPGNGHFPLLATSDAIGMGNLTVCTTTPVDNLDQLGQMRGSDGDVTCDMGAIESGLTPSDPCATATPTTGCTVNGTKDQLCQGTAASDRITGTNGDDVIFGDTGNDTLRGQAGDDTLCGEAGDDVLIGASGDDTLVGGEDDDILRSNNGNDTLLGGDGNDVLIAGSGEDDLQGGPDDDKLIANQDDDNLDGGEGTDTHDGGSGNDTCVNGEIEKLCEN